MKLASILISACVALWTGNASAMTFQMQERCMDAAQPKCQSVVLAQGPIDKESAAQFKSFTKNLPRGTWIAFTSPGGLLVGGLQVGQIIRERGFNTTIGQTDFSPNQCLSSCAYAFMGGNVRFLPTGAQFGLHQFRGSEAELGEANTQKLMAVIANYTDVMGVDRRVLDIAQITAADRVSVLSPTQAKLYKVDNVGQSIYPRWRLEATADGKLLAINNGVASEGEQKKIPLTAAFTPVGPNIVMALFYRSADASLFNTPTPHELQLISLSNGVTGPANGQTIKLTPIGQWQAKENGYQASFQIALSALELLSQAPQDSTLLLTGNFGNTPIQTRLGVAGLNNALQALAQRALDAAQKPKLN